jgi:uncharacterized protein (UPF0332 family)
VTPDDYMAKAARALASAKLLLANSDLDGACNRAYYAMFDAAHAALLRSGAHINPAETRTHRGLIAAFGEHLIKPGLLPTDLGKSFNQVERVRLLADYTGEEIDEDKTRWAVEQAAAFVEAVRRKYTP